MRERKPIPVEVLLVGVAIVQFSCAAYDLALTAKHIELVQNGLEPQKAASICPAGCACTSGVALSALAAGVSIHKAKKRP